MSHTNFRFIVSMLGIAYSVPSSVVAAERIVPDAYPTIQAALDASVDGDVVKVHAGTYHEALTIAKQVTLTAYGGDKVIVDANGVTGLWISADSVTVKKIRIEDASDGIIVTGDGVRITKCEIADTTSRGIYLYGAGAALVEDNEIHDTGGHGIGSIQLEGGWIRNNEIEDAGAVGIRVLGAEIVVEDNRILRPGSHGIQIGDAHYSDGWSRRAFVRGNEIEDAGADGIYFDAPATDCEANSNEIVSPADFGIQLALGADRNALAQNEITYAVEGIGVLADGARLVENTIKHCQYGIGLAPSSNDCLVFGNKTNKNLVWGLYLDGSDHSVTGNSAKKNGVLDAYANGSSMNLKFAGNEFTTANF